MITYSTVILKFGENGDKTGWTYIEVPADIAEELNPGMRKSYRVSGRLDKYVLEGVALLPAGGGAFILALNAAIRKGIAKKEGAMLQVTLELSGAYRQNEMMLACLEDVPEAMSFFRSLSVSHQNYYSKWIDSAKTQPTREKRVVTVVAALAKGQNYAEMIRASYKKNQLP